MNDSRQVDVATRISSPLQDGLEGNPRQGLIMGTWGFFIGFAAVALYGPAARAFQQSMDLSPLLVGRLVAAPQLTGSLLRIPFGAWVDKVGGRLPMLTLFGTSIVGMWGLVFVLDTVPHVTVALYPIIMLFGFMSGCGVASFSVGVPQVSYWSVLAQHLDGAEMVKFMDWAQGILTLHPVSAALIADADPIFT